MPATSPVNTTASNAAKTTLAARARREKLTYSLQGMSRGQTSPLTKKIIASNPA
jgi:hypothetical protein